MEMKTKFKLFMEKLTGPVYNGDTNEISGCKEGSLVYYHELGHRRQMKRGLLTLDMWIRVITFSILTAFLVGYFFFMIKGEQIMREFLMNNGLLVTIPMVTFYWYIEFEAWVYAFIQKYKVKESKNE